MILDTFEKELIIYQLETAGVEKTLIGLRSALERGNPNKSFIEKSIEWILSPENSGYIAGLNYGI